MITTIKNKTFQEWVEVYDSMQEAFTVVASGSDYDSRYRVIKPKDESQIILQHYISYEWLDTIVLKGNES